VWPGHFVGLDYKSTGYRIYNPAKRCVSIEREVVFNLDNSPSNLVVLPDEIQSEGERHSVVPDPPTILGPIEAENMDPEDAKSELAEDPVPEMPDDAPVPALADPGHPPAPLPSDERPWRPRTKTGHYRLLNEGKAMLLGESTENQRLSDDFPSISMEFALVSSPSNDPKTLAEVFRGPFANDWKRAWSDELAVLKCLGTWKLVDLPPGMPTIPCHPIFKTKLGPHGEVVRRKIRLVAGGHKQEKGVNYNETFPSAARMASNRIVLA
jgi:hypothetical protein